MTADKDAEIARLKREIEEMAAKLKANAKLTDEIRHELEEDGRCPICHLNYSKIDRLPMVGRCGHTICERCIKMMDNYKCPLCRTTSFLNPSKNFLACSLLEKSNLLEPVVDVNNTILILGEPPAENQTKFPWNYWHGITGFVYWNKITGFVLSGDRSKWFEIRLKMPYNTYAGGAVYLNEEIYILGGENNPKALYKLDKNLEWVRLADMNIGRSWIANTSVIWNGCIWVLGGIDPDGKCLKSVEKYDPQEDKWTFMP